MSFSNEKRNRIIRYLLEKIEMAPTNAIKKTMEAFNISANTVYRYVRELEERNIILKNGRSLSLAYEQDTFVLHRGKGELEEEDRIYETFIRKYIQDFPENVRKIWEYSFMEMMNNAIDHSEAEVVHIVVLKNYINTSIIIADTGVGIFRKIKEYYGYGELDDAINELFKGKLTTDASRHSGEGIFFTSRILDKFMAISDGKIFSHSNFNDVLEDLENIGLLSEWKEFNGTCILMGLSNSSNKVLKEVFDMFADVDGGFTKTNIPVKNVFAGFPVSRSQAKRLCNRFEEFEIVELDFEGISEIGQGFAHEIFVVFQNNHENVSIVPRNASEDVMRMINHVKKN